MKSPVVCSKEMLEIALAYDLKIKKLKEEENKFLDDEVVKMYFNVLKEIKKTEQDKQSALHKYNSNMQKNCIHPMYVCYNYDTPVRIDYYECMCLHCGKITSMTYKKVDELYQNKRILAIPKTGYDYYLNKDMPYYSYSNEFRKAKEYYLNLYENLDELIVESLEREIPVEDLICEKTFEHFIKPKEKVLTKD